MRELRWWGAVYVIEDFAEVCAQLFSLDFGDCRLSILILRRNPRSLSLWTIDRPQYSLKRFILVRLLVLFPASGQELRHRPRRTSPIFNLLVVYHVLELEWSNVIWLSVIEVVQMFDWPWACGWFFAPEVVDLVLHFHGVLLLPSVVIIWAFNEIFVGLVKAVRVKSSIIKGSSKISLFSEPTVLSLLIKLVIDKINAQRSWQRSL